MKNGRSQKANKRSAHKMKINVSSQMKAPRLFQNENKTYIHKINKSHTENEKCQIALILTLLVANIYPLPLSSFSRWTSLGAS